MNESLEPEYHLAEKMRAIITFYELSEQEIVKTLDSISTLQISLWHILLLDDEFVEEITSSQHILSKWQGLVGFALISKQEELTDQDLSSWDNEGGNVEALLLQPDVSASD